ncbi:hypothetical protein EYF80_023472 [Liparis tanakae]|uniref:Uncharacterized protein n=1 Tax=Liparis tanakae TaxID=230148 RepID=A0A4Z2HKN2_9TELE|nr:hypothetical protein EYF80_023472 [Liparis tanakae]
MDTMKAHGLMVHGVVMKRSSSLLLVPSPHLQVEESGGDPHLQVEESGGDPHLQVEESGGDPHLQVEESGGDPLVMQCPCILSRLYLDTGQNQIHIFTLRLGGDESFRRREERNGTEGTERLGARRQKQLHKQLHNEEEMYSN